MYFKKAIAIICSAIIIATTSCIAITQAADTTNTTASPSSGVSKKCSKSVNTYLRLAKRKKININQTVTTGSNIIVDYIGRLSDGTVFDTSIKSVAKACGTYQTERDYKSGLPFTAGSGQMIEGFDRGVISMNLGTTKTITIPADQAYGGKYISIPLDQLPTKADNTPYTTGDTLMSSNGLVTIESLSDKEFTILNSHPLAGKDLIFDVTIKKISTQ